ncbi:hypothetical protein FPV67DRAFT_1669406 [Lyophyllum atratum]|nr:hypothetical protein FPV67DRAFT_1669406 [Lyophyllum atratum]
MQKKPHPRPVLGLSSDQEYLSDYLTAADSVLATEARHASWIASAVSKFSGWSGNFDVPLSPNEVFTMSSAFITSCSSTNPVNALQAFPGPSLPSQSQRPKLCPALLSPSSSVPHRPAHQEGKVTIPKDLIGTLYVAVDKIETKADDSDIVAGSTELHFESDPQGTVVA